MPLTIYNDYNSDSESFRYLRPMNHFRQNPFGMLVQERVYTAAEYRFGFQGQEKDDEISGNGNSNTAEFWQYDTRLGRRWNVDPEGTKWESPYAVLRNSPILFLDRLGNIWDPAHESESESEAQKLESKATSQKKFAEQSKQKYEKQLDRLLRRQEIFGETNRRQEKIDIANERIGELKNDINEYDNTICEINKMRSDPEVIFRLNPTATGSKGGTEEDAGVVVISYPSGNYELQAHEMKHGYQVISGDIDYNKFNSEGGLIEDIGDEIAGFRRGLAFSTALTKPLYSQINRDFLIAKDEIYETGYGKLPTENLNVNTTIEVLKRVHAKDIRLSEEYKGSSWLNPYRDLGEISAKYNDKKLSDFKEFKSSLIIKF